MNNSGILEKRNNLTSLTYRSKKDFHTLGESLFDLKSSYGVVGIKQNTEHRSLRNWI